jgi:TatA/E family protein of Tat protein translocase
VFLLSPPKLLVVLVVALLVLGPDKLPKVAKQIGTLLGEFRAFRQKLEAEVRGTFPDLPSTDTVVRAVRSPLTLLDTLSDDQRPPAQVASEPAGPAGADTGIGDPGADPDPYPRRLPPVSGTDGTGRN